MNGRAPAKAASHGGANVDGAVVANLETALRHKHEL